MAREMKDSGIGWVGKIPDEWVTLRIKYLANDEIDSFQDGDWIESPYITDTGIRYLTTGNVGDGIFKRQGNGFISEDTFVELNCKYAYPNDLVISRLNAPYGRACVLPADEDKYVLAVDIVILRTNHCKRFLCYLMQCAGYQDTVQDVAKGTTMKRISRTNLGNIVLPIAPIEQQRQIADFLDAECVRIDAVIEQTRASIEEYKKLKQSVITQAVTKGIRPNRPMKDSGIAWIGQTPIGWNTYRIANLFDERNESGQEDLPILTVSINTGISDHEVADEEQIRAFVRSEDRTKYKRVYPGDLAYNMMRAWQGAFGAVRVDGMVSPAYVIAKPKGDIKLDSRYMEALLRTPTGIEEMHRFSYGVADFRLRLYWPEFKNICVCIPPYEEQKEIADYIDEKSREIDRLIDTKNQLLIELDAYKKTVIYEYVTGKKEVPVCQ